MFPGASDAATSLTTHGTHVSAASAGGPMTCSVSQLLIEYDPQPPFDRGSLEKSSEAVRDRLADYMAQSR